MLDYNKPCIIKIWYWNCRDLNNQYSNDNKKINFEILQDNKRIILMTYDIPCFLNGYDMVNSFLKDKYEVIKFLPKLNYNQNFDTYKLNYNLILLEQGDNDIRFKS